MSNANQTCRVLWNVPIRKFVICKLFACMHVTNNITNNNVILQITSTKSKSMADFNNI